MANEIRRDPLLNRAVIVAENRAARPQDFVSKLPKRARAGRECSFDAGKEHLTPPETARIGDRKRWFARAFWNKYPAVSKEFPKAKGSHEVIVENPEHIERTSRLSPLQLETGIELYAARVHELYKSPGIRFVNLFKNEGPDAGVSIAHVHSQLMALNEIPSLVQQELDAYRLYRKKNGDCPYCELVEAERKGPRKAFENEEFLVTAPYASRMPYELMILPKQHLGNITQLGGDERYGLAKMLSDVLKKLDRKFNEPGFNLVYHLAPKGVDSHFHLELLPRLAIWAGFELGSGWYINSVTPEKAARFWRA